jgi:uncharacterized membrane protein YfcA
MENFMATHIMLIVAVTSSIQSLFGVGILLFGTPLLLLFGYEFVDKLNLPLIIEFYELPERVESVIDHLQNHMGLSHVVSWSVTNYFKSL